MDRLLDDVPCGVVVCKEDGSMLYANKIAQKYLTSESQNVTDYNILTSIDTLFKDRAVKFLQSIHDGSSTCNFIYVKLVSVVNKYFKIVAKKSDEDTDNIVLMCYDYTPVKVQQDSLMKSYNEMNDSLIRNAMVLRVMSNICNNVLYKDRSSLSDIVLKLAYAFHLQRSAICFRNGTGHVIYANRRPNKTYDCGTIEDSFAKDKCIIWQNEINYIYCKELLFKVPICTTCAASNEQNVTVNILKLKLDSQKVIGFFEFVEDPNFKLSDTELEILESLSQLLAYIINNKEQVTESTNYIKEKFRSLTQKI